MYIKNFYSSKIYPCQISVLNEKNFAKFWAQTFGKKQQK